MTINKASIITIGDELLIGQTIDTNSAWIGRQFNMMGIDLVRRVAVGDDKAAMLRALNEELTTSDIVVLTGGLGPTADDITKPFLLDYFGGTMRTDEAVLAHVTEIFSRRNKPMLEVNRKQAEVPDSCTVLFNSRGTAPGMWFERDNKVVISLPGVPHEMAGIMQDEALPRLRKLYVSNAIEHLSVITAGEGESFIAERIKDIEAALPKHIKLAYLPGAGMVKLRLTGKGTDAATLLGEMRPFQKQLAERVSEFVVALEDIPLEQVLHNWFTTNNKKLALAESCTGGYLAHLFTQIPGASTYFNGGIVCYSNDSKINILGVDADTINREGVISEAVAAEMATNALTKFGADVAFGVTGLFGPASATDEQPVGTVWMAVANNTRTETMKYRFHYDRARNKEMTTTMALLMMLRFVEAMSA